jgi:hypothetical protein
MSFNPLEGIVKAIHFVKGNVLNVINPAVNGSPDQKDTKKNRKRRKRRRTCALFVVPKCSGRMFIHLPPYVRLNESSIKYMQVFCLQMGVIFAIGQKVKALGIGASAYFPLF